MITEGFFFFTLWHCYPDKQLIYGMKQLIWKGKSLEPDTPFSDLPIIELLQPGDNVLYFINIIIKSL